MPRHALHDQNARISRSKLRRNKLKRRRLKHELLEDRRLLAAVTVDPQFELQNGDLPSGQGITVGVWDGGRIYDQHNEFKAAGSGNTRVEIREISEPFDNHATHVAGIIGGNTYGVAPDARLASYDFPTESFLDVTT